MTNILNIIIFPYFGHEPFLFIDTLSRLVGNTLYALMAPK